MALANESLLASRPRSPSPTGTALREKDARKGSPSTNLNRIRTITVASWKKVTEVFDTLSSPKNTLLVGSFLAFAVFVANLGLTIWASTTEESNGSLFRRDCSSVQSFSTGIHLLLNVLSTLLLSASNFGMQYLSAPTRADLDMAHGTDRWMDIGIQSLKNLRHLKWPKLAIWFCLCLSSLPLHLLYNSMFFSSLPDHYYDVYYVTEDWPQGAWFDEEFWPPTQYHPSGGYYVPPSNWSSFVLPNGTTGGRECTGFDGTTQYNYCTYQTRPLRVQTFFSQNASHYEQLNPSECIRQYSNNFLRQRSNVALVGEVWDEEVAFQPTLESWLDTNQSTRLHHAIDTKRSVHRDSSLLWATRGKDGGNYFDTQAVGTLPGWMCHNATDPNNFVCSTNQLNQLADEVHSGRDWILNGFKVSHCLSQKAEAKCKMNFNRPIAITVVVMNFCKTLLILCVYLMSRGKPILTIGDAIASFLNDPDETTRGSCLADQKHFINLPPGSSSLPLTYEPRRHRRAELAGWSSWLLYLFCCAVTLAAVGGLLGQSLDALQKNGHASIIEAGFGKVTPDALVDWNLSQQGNDAVMSATIISNLPQLVLSGLYLLLNNIITRLFITYEWSRFRLHRKGLRISHKVAGDQRSSFYLTIPLRYGIPFQISSTLIHWLASQSIFFAKIDAYAPQLERPISRTTCGFSPLAIILALCMGFVIIFATMALGWKHTNVDMPLAGSCSKAIAASCHPPEDGNDPTLAVQWGAIPGENEVMEIDGESRPVGHCSFSSGEVESPKRGELYA